MQYLRGKMAGLMSSLLTGKSRGVSEFSDTKDDELKLLVVDCRTELIDSIQKGKDGTKIIKELTELNCPLSDKYAILQVDELLAANNQSLEELKHITTALSVIVKYAHHLIKKCDQRREQWHVIHFTNAIVQKKIKPMKGFENVLQQLGYTEKSPKGLSYPNGVEPDEVIIVNLIADMLLFRKEIKEYILGRHLYPHHLQLYIPAMTQKEVQVAQMNGLKCEDEDLSEPSSTQISSIASESQADDQLILASAQQSYLDTNLVPEAERVTQSNRIKTECNNNSLADEDFQSATSVPIKVPNVALSSDVQFPMDTETLVAQHLQDETGTYEQTTTEPVQAIPDLVTPTNEPDTVTPDSSGRSSSLRLACNVCGDDAMVYCENCSDKPLCNGCNINWHRHPNRQGHIQKSISVLALMSPNSLNPVNIDGAYGISAQTNKSPYRVSQMQQTHLVNQKLQNKQTAAEQNLYSPQMIRRFHDGQDPHYRQPNHINSESAEQLQEIHYPSDYPRLQNVNSQHYQQQLQYAHLPAADLDTHQLPYHMAYTNPGLLYSDQVQGHLHSPMNPGHQFRSHVEKLSPMAYQEQLLENSEYLPDMRNRLQHTLPYIRQQNEDHSQSVLLQQRQQSLNWYPNGRPHNQYPYSHGIVQRPGDMGFTGYASGGVVPPSMFTQMHSNAGQHFPNSKVPVSSQQVTSPNNSQSARNSYMVHPDGTLRYVNMDAQMNMQSSYSPLRGHAFPAHDGHQSMPVIFAGGPNSISPNHHYNFPVTDFSQPGLQDPAYKMSRQYSANSLSSSSSSLNNTLSLLQDELNQTPDVKSRVSKCDSLITERDMAIKVLEQQINHVMEADLEAVEKDIFRDLSKKKAYYMQQKKFLVACRQQLEDETALLKLNFPEEVSQQIHYPPDIDLSFRANNKPLGVDTSPERVPHVAAGVQDADVLATPHHQLAKANINNNAGATSSTSASVLARNTEVKPYTLAANSSQVSSSQASPPTIPNRRPKSEAILSMILPSPKVAPLTNVKNWSCQHCTFLNDATAPVCVMCENTPLFEGSSGPDHLAPESNPTSGLQDSFLDMLEEIKKEQEIEKKEKNDDMYGIRTPLAQAVGSRIRGSQEQVMIEKKKAQQEFMHQQQKEKQASSKASPTDVKSKSPSPVPVTSPAYDTDKKQKSSAAFKSEEGSHEYHNKAAAAAPLPSNLQQNTAGQQHQLVKPGFAKDEAKDVGKEASQNSCDSSTLVDILARFNEITMIDSLQAQGAEFAKLIKVADQEGFDVEAVQIAQIFCESQSLGPIDWLKKHWKKNVNMVASMATKAGNEQQQNSVGEVSEEEAEAAYISCHGNMKDAAHLCVSKRAELYELLNALGDYPREEILQTMFQCRGNREAAEKLLVESTLQPFLENIWAEKDTDARNRFALDLGGPLPEMCHSFSTSIIFHGEFQKMVMDKNVNKDRRTRMIFVEGQLRSWGRAELVIKILDNDLPDNVSLEDVVEAVRNCQDRNSALAYLQQQCALCFANFPMSKIRNLNFCPCKMCEECLTKNFEIGIREKHVRHWTCPLCSLPDMNDADIASDYLHLLILMLQPLIDRDLQNLFETKVRDWHLQKEKLFRWCAHCAMGFLAENLGDNLRMTCPHCGEKTCFQCKREWEPQHEGLTCEQFAQWKIDNDPNNQSEGLAKHLDENGIDCPQCKMRFALAKGGCMHFKCPQCGHEFCSGCNEPFHQKDVCNKFKICKKLGLHCHCPRDCFSYLRDHTIQQLQQLLKVHNVAFNINTPDDQTDPHHCPVMEQKEFDLGKKDEKCGKDTIRGQAGLCEIHYKEYLVCLINRHKLDPVILMSKEEMANLLQKYDLQAPKQKAKETPEEYTVHLVKVIKEKLPLRKR
ncbi:hypothetical protein BsWGS_16069 [Bradybaena similaris]